MKIALGNDHAGTTMKKEIREYLCTLGHEVIDFGDNTGERCDYPVFAEKVANAVIGKEADYGILICGTGIGISIAANKVKGIRCAVCARGGSRGRGCAVCGGCLHRVHP